MLTMLPTPNQLHVIRQPTKRLFRAWRILALVALACEIIETHTGTLTLIQRVMPQIVGTLVGARWTWVGFWRWGIWREWPGRITHLTGIRTVDAHFVTQPSLAEPTSRPSATTGKFEEMGYSGRM